jgi:hypothetical protein
MAEWLKAHAWKACVPQGTVGSNPTLSATIECAMHISDLREMSSVKANRFAFAVRTVELHLLPLVRQTWASVAFVE